jgi:hypothetical protein
MPFVLLFTDAQLNQTLDNCHTVAVGLLAGWFAYLLLTKNNNAKR